MRSHAFLFFLVLATQGCSAPEPARPDLQRLVLDLQARDASILRLSVHMVPASGPRSIVVASTSNAKLGKVSDPEDLRAMASAQQVVLDESGALDVTVPICVANGRAAAAVGVTMAADAASPRAAAVARAEAVAREIERNIAR